MIYRRKLCLIIIGLTLFSVSSFATKPCSLSSYFSNSKRSNEDWVSNSIWAAKVKVLKVIHKWESYPNCTQKNKSQCSKQDVGVFEAEILEVLKGEIKGSKFNFKAAYCSKGIPEKEGIYIFYGLSTTGYDGYYKSRSE